MEFDSLFFSPHKVTDVTQWSDWRELVFETFHGLEVGAAPKVPFDPVHLQTAGNQSICTCWIRAPAQSVNRSSAAARRLMSDQIAILHIDSGHACMEQDGRRIVLDTSDIVIFSNAKPYRFEMTEPLAHSMLLVNRSRWGPEIATIDHAGLTKLQSSVSKRLLSAVLRDLVIESSQASTIELENLSLPVLQIALASMQNNVIETASRRRVSRSLMERIRADIRCHLMDPSLDPRMIAARHNISLRYLHKLFAIDGTAMMRFVRQERLSACLNEIQNASGRPHIGSIATRWGFEDEGSFRRAFRAAYGRPPSSFCSV